MSDFWLRLVFSPFIIEEKRSRKIAYVAMMVALAIVSNIFFEFKLGTVQYSLTTLMSALIGLLLGPGAGFIACFIGDAVGFFVNPFGAYTPWIGLATGLVAFITGFVFHFFQNGSYLVLYIKLSIITLATFFICSIGINSTFLWLAYFNKATFFEFLFTRYIIQGQLYVSIVNYALLFLFATVIKRVSYFDDLGI